MLLRGPRRSWGGELFYPPVLLYDVPVFLAVADEEFTTRGDVTHGVDEDPESFDAVGTVVIKAFAAAHSFCVVGITGQGVLCGPCVDDMVTVDVVDIAVEAIAVVDLLPFRDLSFVLYNFYSFGDVPCGEEPFSGSFQGTAFDDELFFQ